MPLLEWQVIELFAGVGNVSAAFREYGKAVASLDKEIGGDCMDFALNAGFLPGTQKYNSITYTLWFTMGYYGKSSDVTKVDVMGGDERRTLSISEIHYCNHI